MLYRCLILLASLLLGSALANPVLIDLSQVRTQVKVSEVQFFDVRDNEKFLLGHIPNAINVGEGYGAFTDAKTNNLKTAAAAAELLNNAGVDLSRAIVVYGARGSSRSYFVAFALHYFGAKQVMLFADGWDAWQEAKLPTSKAPSAKLAVLKQTLSVNSELLIELPELVAHLGDKNIQLIDARTPAEFHGQDFPGWRGGHIPGAINIPFQSHWRNPNTSVLPGDAVDTRDLSVISMAQRRALYQNLDPKRETILYCLSGGRSSATYLMLKSLGFENLRLYDGSWHEYGNQLHLPVAEVSYRDPEAMQSEIDALSERVKVLEAELAKAKSRQ